MSGIRCDRERTIAVRQDRARVVAFLAAALAAGGPKVYREAPRGHFAGALPMKKFRARAQRGRKTKRTIAARRREKIAKESRRRNRRR